MGTTKSIEFIINQQFPLNQYQWIIINDLTQKHKLIVVDNPNNKCTVYDQMSQIICQRYVIREYESIEYQLQMILFRKQNSSCIVTVKDVKLQTKLSSSSLIPDCMLLNTHNKSFSIILQHIPYRLGDIGMLRFQQMIYVLEQCFKALQLLWVNFGRVFYIDQDFVCFNDFGQCKVWINQHLQKNKPNIEANFLPKTIIQQVFLLLESRVDQFNVPESYYKFKTKMEIQKFTQALQFIQKIKKHQGIKIYCIKSLKKQPSQSDSIKALNKIQKKRGQSSDQNRSQKYSLKNIRNQRNLLINKKIAHNTPKTTVSKQQHTQVSQRQIYRLNSQQQWVNEFMRETYKSDRLFEKNKQEKLLYTEYSQKKNYPNNKYSSYYKFDDINNSLKKKLF